MARERVTLQIGDEMVTVEVAEGTSDEDIIAHVTGQSKEEEGSALGDAAMWAAERFTPYGMVKDYQEGGGGLEGIKNIGSGYLDRARSAIGQGSMLGWGG